jgi:hypothetical protein
MPETEGTSLQEAQTNSRGAEKNIAGEKTAGSTNEPKARLSRGRSSTINSQRVFDQVCYLRCRVLSVLKNTLITFLPNEPPKEEHNSNIHLLFKLGSCSTNC